MSRSLPSVVLCGLLLVTAVAYRQVGEAGFVNLDDDAYVEFAPMVNKGLRSAAVAWAWLSVHTANWHPLTTLSHMLDCELFGIRPTPMHWENLGWHLLNTALVFSLWRRLTGTLWRSAVVAGLFALHPFHVESVAWISGRKDLLSTFCWLLGIAAYLRWLRSPSPWRYAVVMVCALAALLFKPMAVTFPCTLLLLDAWPLRRWPQAPLLRLLKEKVPLFALVVLHSAVTFLVQHGAGAASYGERIPLDARLGNAFVAYARYIGKTLWPDSFSPLYYHPGYWPLAAVAGAVVLVAALTCLAWRQRQPRPWFLFGWLWFLGTLVPVIGIVQVGSQSMADRYTYVPLLGLFTVLAWGGAEFAQRAAVSRRLTTVTLSLATLALVFLTQHQVQAWRNSTTLYERSIAGGEDNAGIRYLYAGALAAAGRPEPDIAAQYRRAIEHAPDYINAHTQLALIALRHQRFDEAGRIFENNIRLEPRNPGLHINLGSLRLMRGEANEAIRHFEAALQLAPALPGAHRELARCYLTLKQPARARSHYEAAVRSDPWNSADLTELGILTANAGDLEGGRGYLERALWLDPDNHVARDNFARVDRIRTGIR